MYTSYKDEVAFFMVYIREAHPTDGRQVGANAQEKILIKQPTTFEERAEIAEHMCSQLDIKLPPLVDDLEDTVNNAYSAWPDRMYLIGVDGRIAYKGGPGPGGFAPRELEAAIKKLTSDRQDR